MAFAMGRQAIGTRSPSQWGTAGLRENMFVDSTAAVKPPMDGSRDARRVEPMKGLIWSVACGAILLGCSAAQAGRSAAPSGGSGAPLEASASAAPSVDEVSPAPSTDTVKLATADVAFSVQSDVMGPCPYNHANVGLLMVDPGYGTAAQNGGDVHPLIWPLGYTARRLAGGQVAVLSGKVAVVATTGKKYNFWAPEIWAPGGEPVEVGNCVSPYTEGEIQTPWPAWP